MNKCNTHAVCLGSIRRGSADLNLLPILKCVTASSLAKFPPNMVRSRYLGAFPPRQQCSYGIPDSQQKASHPPSFDGDGDVPEFPRYWVYKRPFLRYVYIFPSTFILACRASACKNLQHGHIVIRYSQSFARYGQIWENVLTKKSQRVLWAGYDPAIIEGPMAQPRAEFRVSTSPFIFLYPENQLNAYRISRLKDRS